ncbi:MAG: flagellar export chaperone FlgN [Lachnospiraceae bacterium]|nr:flagellar export chaperone FlgN [Lachnospiraceae bacterium]
MEQRDYVLALQQSLEKKVDILLKVKAMNEQQALLLSEEDPDIDKWDELTNTKGELVDEINFLDEGFNEVYEHVRDELQVNREAYKKEINHMQDLIRKLTELSEVIQSEEARNKEAAMRHFARLKKKGKVLTQSNRAAKLYKDNMQKVNYIDPQFFNEKH